MRALLLLIFALLFAVPADAQFSTATPSKLLALVVSSCGGQSLTAGAYGQVTMTADGKLCINTSGGGGTVTSVGLALPNIFTVSGSPVTTSGTLTGALATQNNNLFFAGPTTGGPLAPTFRTISGADLPAPGASSLGALFAHTAVAHNFLTSVNLDGTVTGAQPASSDLSDASNVALLNTAQTFTAAQRGQPATITISTATFTPNFNTAQNQQLTLVHASCPCTLANPSTTPVAGQSGMFVVTQSATGSDTIGTWGTDYVTAGGTASITLSTAANAVDYIPYYVADSTHIVLGAIINAPTH